MIKIEILTQEAERALKDLARRVADMRPALREIGGELVESTKHRFVTATAPDGTPWKRNQPSTIARKGRDQPLIDGGYLAEQIQSTLLDDHTVLVFSNREYAAIQQFGGSVDHAAQSRLTAFKVNKKTGASRFSSRAKANFEQWTTRPAYTVDIPPRPFLGVSADDERMIIDTVHKHLGQDH